MLGKRPEHTHVVTDPVDDEDWGYAGMLTDEWRARRAAEGDPSRPDPTGRPGGRDGEPEGVRP